MTASPEIYRGGSGEPMILLHGINLSWRIWQPVIPELSKHHAVLAPTLAGHLGGPGLAAGPHGIGPVADAIEALMDETGLAKAHLVGNSLGGWLALELAQRGRALSVVAMSPAGAWRSERDMRRLFRLMRLGARASRWRSTRRLVSSSPGARRAFMRLALERGDLLSEEVALEMLAEARFCVLLEGLLQWIEEHGPTTRFTIDPGCRIRIAWAEHDRTIPFDRYGRPYLEMLLNAEVITMPGVGHVPMYDDPGVVARTILGVTSPAAVVGSTYSG